jgi:hypothetical protein
MSDPERGAAAADAAATTTPPRPSLPRHLARGALGFGLIGSAIALTPVAGPVALLLAPPAIVALRGCPTCWLAGLIESISAWRLQRACGDDGCTLRTPRTPTTTRALPHAGN